MRYLPRIWPLLTLFLSVVCISHAAEPATCPGASLGISPLVNAHAHNDYWHERPLHDALSYGFTSVEADIFLKDKKLLVGHEESELSSDRTLEEMYLKPISKLVFENNGSVYEKPCRFFLMIDLKTERQATYAELRILLKEYSHMLTTWDANGVSHGPVTIVITSAEPIVKLVTSGKRYASIDGRISDLKSDHLISPYQMPLISDKWSKHFKWNGDGPFPAVEKNKLVDIASECHRQGRLLRFWAIPENESVWEELLAAGVDLINADDLEKLSDYLNETLH